MDHEIPVRIVDNQEYMKVVRSILEEGKEVPLVVTGNSMMPFLIDRRDQVLIKRIERPLKKGDIAFFQRENGQYIMHRIHFMRKDDRTGENQFYFIGDGQKNIEGPIKETQIFGVITGVLRKGKYLDEHTFTWRLFKNIWRYVIPFRPLIIKIYSLFKR